MSKEIKLIITGVGNVQSNTLICPDTGDIFIRDQLKNNQSTNLLPVGMFLIELNNKDLKKGDVFVLRHELDVLYYCKELNGNVVTGVEIEFNEGIKLSAHQFDHHKDNVQKVVASSLIDDLFDVKKFLDEQIKHYVISYNNDPNNKIFN